MCEDDVVGANLRRGSALNIVLLGPPGAGKGTQGRRIATGCGIALISNGELLRREVAAATDLGPAVEREIAEGTLVSDQIVFGLLAERLIETPDEGGYVLDGFPRTQSQAEMLDSFGRPRQLAPSIVIVLDAPDGILLARLLARRVRTGREDDRESVARRRLDLYRATVAPLLQFYDRQGVLHHVDATASVETVTEAVLGQLPRNGGRHPKPDRPTGRDETRR